MYLKLTRLDNTPIWLNASFIVTIEPRRGGGAIVVPIGDGLDYDVRESPEAVLQMLSEVPPPAVVPVPAPKMLAPKPSWALEEQPAAEKSAEKPAEKPVEEKPAEKPAEEKPTEEVAAEEKPKKTRKTAAKKTTTAKTTAAKKTRTTRKTTKKAEEPPPPPPPVLELNDAEIARLKKMMPRNIKKLQNTLISQFHVADINQTIEALMYHGIITMEENRVLWQA